MEKTRFVVRVAMCVALLIGGQMALSGISGIEIVTVMLLCFCFHYGIRHGIAVATTFSLLRCFFFGFQVNTIVGAPFFQSGVFHQFISAEGRHDLCVQRHSEGGC